MVDEDEDILEVTETFLGRADGLSVSVEVDPQRALDRVVDGEFDAVVSDLKMPKLDGLELCRGIRDAGVDVPFFLFSGLDESEIMAADGSDCVTAVVQKGTGTDQYGRLASHVRDALD